MSVGKYRLDFTMCYLAVSSLLYFDYSLTDSTFKQPAVHVLIHEPAVLNQIYAEKHASLSFPSAFTRFFSYSTWPAIWLPRALQLRPHANLWHTRCKCGVSLYCLHGRVVVWCSGVPVWRKYWQQDSGEQIEHKVNTFHLDSNATPGLQSSADVKSSAALLSYKANPISMCKYENYGSDEVQGWHKEKGIIPFVKFGTCVPKSAIIHMPLLKPSRNYGVTSLY